MVLPLEERGYLVESNREAGLGRAHILLLPRTALRPGIIIETKKLSKTEKSLAPTVKTNALLKELAEKAITQIRETKYSSRFHGVASSVLLYGVAVNNKSISVAFERMSC